MKPTARQIRNHKSDLRRARRAKRPKREHLSVKRRLVHVKLTAFDENFNVIGTDIARVKIGDRWVTPKMVKKTMKSWQDTVHIVRENVWEEVA